MPDESRDVVSDQSASYEQGVADGRKQMLEEVIERLQQGRRNPRGWWDDWDDAADFIEAQLRTKDMDR